MGQLNNDYPLSDAVKVKDSFNLLVEPLIKYMAENRTPHDILIITNNSAELLEGVKAYKTDEFIKD